MLYSKKEGIIAFIFRKIKIVVSPYSLETYHVSFGESTKDEKQSNYKNGKIDSIRQHSRKYFIFDKLLVNCRKNEKEPEKVLRVALRTPPLSKLSE